ncbi:MAG: hypothetical protein A2583_07640 [Bdellovibrionales bacterium RIFOXYD1_FULL_53_11]|nr:MAG: hypothetical protein A2583_07640 [Bdellovibrionales bacterium RIFOXYD1_FULL_53_11]
MNIQEDFPCNVPSHELQKQKLHRPSHKHFVDEPEQNVIPENIYRPKHLSWKKKQSNNKQKIKYSIRLDSYQHSESLGNYNFTIQVVQSITAASVMALRTKRRCLGFKSLSSGWRFITAAAMLFGDISVNLDFARKSPEILDCALL